MHLLLLYYKSVFSVPQRTAVNVYKISGGGRRILVFFTIFLKKFVYVYGSVLLHEFMCNPCMQVLTEATEHRVCRNQCCNLPAVHAGD